MCQCKQHFALFLNWRNFFLSVHAILARRGGWIRVWQKNLSDQELLHEPTGCISSMALELLAWKQPHTKLRKPESPQRSSCLPCFVHILWGTLCFSSLQTKPPRFKTFHIFSPFCCSLLAPSKILYFKRHSIWNAMQYLSTVHAVEWH